MWARLDRLAESLAELRGEWRAGSAATGVRLSHLEEGLHTLSSEVKALHRRMDDEGLRQRERSWTVASKLGQTRGRIALLSAIVSGATAGGALILIEVFLRGGL